MDEIRKLALDQAVTIATLVKTDKIDAAEVVSAAELFRQFLANDGPHVLIGGGDSATQETVSPVDEMMLSRGVEGLARADQTPDDTKTRLIRPGTEVP